METNVAQQAPDDAALAQPPASNTVANNAQTAEQALMEQRWRRWLAENKIQGLDDKVLLYVMARAGVHPNLVVAELQQMRGHPYIEAAGNLNQLARKLESILAVQRELAALSPRASEIERRRKLNKAEFLEEFYSRNRPVVFTGLIKDWKALSRWTPQYLKEKLGDTEVEVQVDRNSDPLYERNLDQHRKKMPFSAYADMVMSAGETNDFYMVANNKNFDRASPMQTLIEDIDFPEFIDGSQWREKMFFWFGPKGTITPVHHDPMNVLLSQVSGGKRVKLISPNQTPFLYNYVGVFSEVDVYNPDLERFPAFKNVRPIEFDLNPGESLFIPVGWWHAVVSKDVSVSVSMTNFVFPNTFNWQNPSLAR